MIDGGSGKQGGPALYPVTVEEGGGQEAAFSLRAAWNVTVLSWEDMWKIWQAAETERASWRRLRGKGGGVAGLGGRDGISSVRGRTVGLRRRVRAGERVLTALRLWTRACRLHIVMAGGWERGRYDHGRRSVTCFATFRPTLSTRTRRGRLFRY